MNIHHAEIGALLTRFQPSTGSTSWNKKDRTLRAIISVGAPVVRQDYDGPYTERLDLDGVELAARIPFLNSHKSYDLENVIGTVQSVERVEDRLEAVIKLSRRKGVDEFADDIADGVIGSISIGYRVFDWNEVEDDDGSRTKIATRWQILEVSAVAIPADPAAQIRGQNMTMTTDPASPEVTPRSRAARIATELEIRGLASIAGLNDAFVAEQVAAGVTLGQARTAVIDAMAERQAKQPATRSMIGAPAGAAGFDNPEFRAAAMADAIVARAMPGHEPSEAARQFVGLTLPELARESLRLSNVDTRGMSPSAVIQRSFAGNTTSDFAVALSSAVGLVLRRAYAAAPGGLKAVARPISIADFRAQTHVSLSGFSALEKVNEHGEFRRGTIEDAGESVKLETFGKIFGITRQAIINDNLNAFADMPRRMGLAASQFEAEQLAALVVANPQMSDGKAVFHADHGNLAASGAAPGETTLSAARLALRTQRDDANQLIGLAPKFLIVGPQLETDAEKLMAAITAMTTDDVQPIKLSVIVEPRLAGKAWFISADPAVADGLVYAHLAGEPGPQIEHRYGFDIDGLEMKVRLDFGAAFIDHRSWFKNPGA